MLLCLAGCIGWGDDLFSERSIIGQYRLKAWEDGSFYLLTPADTTDIFHGAPVQRVGWDSSHVLMLRPEADSEPAVWTVIDAATGQSRVLRTQAAVDSALAHIPTFRPDSAWDKLGSR